MAVRRVVVFLPLPDRATHDELQALADEHGGVLPDAHWGPDGRVRGTAILSDTAQALTTDRTDTQDDL